MRSFTFLFITLFISGCAGFMSADRTQTADLNDQLMPFSELITEDFLLNHLTVLAHDSLEGRETGMPGQKKAAQYLADVYTEMGATPKGDDGGWYQSFILNANRTDSLVYRTYSTSGNDTTLLYHSVFSDDSTAPYLRLFGGNAELNGDVVFAGFGVNDPTRGVEHLEGVDMTNTWVLIFGDLPSIVDGDTLFNPGINNNNRLGSILTQKDAAGILVIGDASTQQFEEAARISSMLLTKPTGMALPYLQRQGAGAGFPKGYMQIHPQLAVEMLGLNSMEELDDLRSQTISTIREFSPHKLPYHISYKPYTGPVEVETENVIAFIEGGDPDLKDEVVVLTAHYDHIGITQPDARGDMINNGADDDGSGTVALMAVANALQEAANQGLRPKRSILFVHVTAEEKGLLGSRYYSDHPVIPVENTVASFNADMIGRSDQANIQAGDTDYVYVIGGKIISSELDSLVHAANEKSVGMRLDEKYNDLQDANQFYRRSDHWNLGRLEVPFVFFFTGVHEDYHRPSDEVDKIDFVKLTRISRLIYTSTIMVANYDGRPVVDSEEFIQITRQQPR
jgi:hypothetical protein